MNQAKIQGEYNERFSFMKNGKRQRIRSSPFMQDGKESD
jgi:hypothetical protein